MKKSLVSVSNGLNAELGYVTATFGAAFFAAENSVNQVNFLATTTTTSPSDNFWYIGITPPQSPKNIAVSVSRKTVPFNIKNADQASDTLPPVVKNPQITRMPPEVHTKSNTGYDSDFFIIETPGRTPDESREASPFVSPYGSRESSKESMHHLKPTIKSEPITIPPKKPLSLRCKQ